MKNTIKRLTAGATRLLVLALGLGLVSTGWAAAPVAVWDGAADSVYDFSNLTHNGYVLGNLGSGYYNSVAADYSYLQIGNENQKAAITLKKSSGNMGASTVIIRCENLMDHEGCNRAVLSFLNNNNPYIGVGQYNSGSHMSSFIWSNAMWDNSANVKKDGAFSGSPITIALAYSYNDGTEYYVDGEKICSAGGLRASGYGPQGVCIGGVGADGSGMFYAMKGMKVTAIAFFDSKISDADIAAYRFPSEYIKYTKISADTSVSGINAQIDTANFESNTVSVANGVRITVDEAFGGTSEAPLPITSAGSITLYADPQPATSYFTGVDFSGVKGGVLRSWLTPGVVGYNFRSTSGSDTSLALVSGGTWLPASTADDASGSTTEMFADGLSTFAWSSKNTWEWSSGTLLNGYLDDGGSQAKITLSNVPYETYDVIVYAATDTEDYSFKAVTVNGTQYTWDENSGEAVAGSATWGISHQPLAAYGKNALRIKNLSGPLEIKGGSNSNNARGCIAAVQIMPTTAVDVEVMDYTLTLDGTAKNWSTGTWTSGGIEVSAPTLARNVEIVATASTALTIDSAVKVSQLTISGAGASVVTMSNGSGGSLSVGEVVVASGILKPNGTPSTSMKLRVQDGGAIDLASAAASGYYVKIAGQGVLKDGVYTGALFSSANISGGAAQLRGITLSANATIRCDYNWGIIRSNYDSGTLSLGGYTLTKVGSANFWICNVTDSASGNIVVSEGNFATIKTKSTFSNATLTIGDGATLRMDTPDGGGATDLEVKNLVCDAGSTVNIAAARTLKVTTALTANGTMKPLGTVTCNGSMTIGGDVVVPSDKTWTVAGTLTVADGGKLEIKNNALVPGALALADGGTLKIAKVSDAAHKVTAGTVTFPASGAAIIDVSDIPDLDENDKVDVLTGNTSLPSDVSTLKIVGKQCSLESESNTLKVVNDGGLVWDDGWTTGKDPTKYGDAIIASSGTVALGGTSLSFDSVTLSGSGTVSFSATGSETVSIKNLEIGAGVTLTANAALDLTGCTITGDGTLDIPVGTTYAMDGVTSSAKVTVEGTLETSGTTTLSAANTSAQGSLIHVVGDSTTLSTCWQGMSGDINVASGATLKFGASLYEGEDLHHNNINPNGTLDIDVYGTLNVGQNRLELGSGITFNIHANARVEEIYYASSGALYWTGNGVINVDGDAATLAARINIANNVVLSLDIDDDASLAITSAFIAAGGGSITKAGAGTLDLTAITPSKPMTINAGTVVAVTAPTTAVVNEAGILKLTNTDAYKDDRTTNMSGITGTGTIRYNGSGWRSLPNSSGNVFADTLSVELEQESGVPIVVDNTVIGSISGSKNLRSDLGSSGKTFTVKQAKDGVWSGSFHGGWDGLEKFIVQGGASSTGTLTLAGYSTADGSNTYTDKLEVASSGSVNLTGLWIGDTTVDGTFGGTGTLDGALIFNEGSTFKVWATDADGLVATGALTPPASGKVTVDVSDLTLGANDSYPILTVGSGLSNTSSFADLDSETHMLSVSSGTLYVVPIAATVTSGSSVTKCSSVDAAIGTMVMGGDKDAYVTVLRGTTTYTEEELAEYNVVYDSSDSTYSLAAAQIESTQYGTLAKAIAAAASSGDTVTLLRDCTVTNLSLAGKMIILDEGEFTFTGSFTGNGTLALPDGTLLKSPSPDRWAEGWTGTVWIRNYTSLTGISTQGGATYGSTSFEPNSHGNVNSTVRFTGVKGYFTAHNNESYTIQPALELEDDGETPGLLLYNGWGYNQNAQCYTVVRKLKGSGTLKADSTSPASSVLLQVLNWDDFTGTLTMPKKTVVFGSTRPEQAEVDGGGCIAVQSGASVVVPAGKTWTVGSGVVVYGNLSLGAGASIVNTTAANTWIKCGSGTVTLNALSDLPASPASGWTGTVELPSFAAAGQQLNTYGVSGSKIKINGITSGYLSAQDQNIQPEIVLAGNFNITDMSERNYTFSKFSGTGNITFTPKSYDLSSLTITELAEGYSGTVANNMSSTTLNIGTLALPEGASVAGGTKILTTGGSGAISVSSVTVGGATQSGLQLAYVANDGVYVAVATYGGNGYRTLAEAIADAEAGTGIKDITVLSGAVAPEGYYISDGSVYKCLAYVSKNSGASTNYCNTAIDVAMQTYGGANTYDYVMVLQSGAVELMWFPGYKLKNPNGATITFSNVTEEYTLEYSEEDGLRTYANSTSNRATTYTWTGADSTEAANGDERSWGAAGNWTFVDSSSQQTIATRCPQAGDTVIVGEDATISLRADATATTLYISGPVVFCKGSDLPSQVTRTLTLSDSVVLTDAAATLTVSGGVILSPTPTTTVADSYVKQDGSTYLVDAYNTVSFTASNATVNRTDALGNAIKDGDTITFTIAPDPGYKVTSVTAGGDTLIADNGVYSYTVTADATITVATAQESSVEIGAATFAYGVDYTNATVTVAVTETNASGTEYTLTVNGRNYTSTATTAQSGTTVTFTDVEVPRGAAYGTVNYTINSDADITTGGGARSAAVENVIADGWINERAASTTGTSSSAAGAGGSWTNAVTYTDGAATITDNRFEATQKSTTSRVVMEFNVCFTATSDGDVSGEAQGALKLGEVNDEATFMVLTNANQWAAVSNVGLTPDPTATNKVVMTFDYANNTYSVSVDDYVLTDGTGSSSFPLAKNNATGVQDIDFAGTGTLVSMKGDQLEGYMVKDNAGGWYATIEAATQSYDSANGPYTVLHDGTAPSGWKIDGSTLIKVATGLFFMAY